MTLFALGVVGLPGPMIVTIILPIIVAAFAFWLWALVDCLTKEPDTGNTKICWVLVILFAHFAGALIYFLVRRDQRLAEVGR